MKPLPLLFALCLLFVACAVDRPPTGGPKDTAPLEILSVDPPPSSVNTSPQKILFTFNRYVPAWSLRKALVFSPAVTDYNLKADGKEAEILFTQPLDSNKTYTITLNTSLRSSRGNELVQSYTYAFSTGDKINRGIIGGQVFSNDNRPAPHALVLAYAVTNDTLSFNPLERKPDYSVQTGKNGKFTLEYLAEGSYRLLALQDRNGDQRLSPESEFFGVGQRKLVKTGSLDNLFRLAEPRLDPLPVYCSTPADNLLEITFNRSIPVDEFDITSLAVTDTLSNASVPIKGYYSLKNTREAVTFGVVSGKLDKKSGYRITYKGHTAPTICRGSDKERKETIILTELFPKNGEQTAFLRTTYPERGRTVDISFNIPVEKESLRHAVKLYRVKGENISPLAFTISPVDSRRYTLQADPGFSNGSSYRVDMQLATLIGLNGEKASDSLATSIFTVADSGDFGSITGTVSGGAETVVVEALDSVNRLPRRTVVQRTSTGPADFTIDELAPGNYTMRAFIPRSEPGQDNELPWNPGNIHPFEPADLFAVNRDTVTVRKGWATENVNIIFPIIY